MTSTDLAQVPKALSHKVHILASVPKAVKQMRNAKKVLQEVEVEVVA